MDYITTVALALSGLIGIILLAVALAGMGSGFHGRTTYAAGWVTLDKQYQRKHGHSPSRSTYPVRDVENQPIITNR